MKVRREPNETDNYYRRERLETALAQDLITNDRNLGPRLKDQHLMEVSPAEAAAAIAASRGVAVEAAVQASRGMSIGNVWGTWDQPATRVLPDITPPPFRGR
jgi:hypothetical protein